MQESEKKCIMRELASLFHKLFHWHSERGKTKQYK